MSPLPDATATELFAENTALRELLEVYEATSVEQAQKLGRALDALAENSKRLLEAERERSRLAEAQAQRLKREFEIAAQIQTSILPRLYRVEGFDVAASMVPAELVGGDYYDVIPTEKGCWFGIGDVSGHGLTAGLIMLMAQCAFLAMVRKDPGMTPAEAITTVNDVLFENVRRRLGQSDHMTLTLLRLDADGRLQFAGAHEELMILRHESKQVERLTTPGTWAGGMSDVAHVTVDTATHLHVGDTLILYSDGITEAQERSTKEQFGPNRLAEVMLRAQRSAPAAICHEIFRAVDEWSPARDDDRTVVVIRREA